MKLHRITLLFALGLFAGTLWLTHAAAEGQSEVPRKFSPRIAVCDVVEAYGRLPHSRELVKHFEARAKRLSEQAEAQRRRIQDAQGELSEYKLGSEQYIQHGKALRKMTFELEVWEKFENAQLHHEQTVLTRKAYLDIMDTAAKVARDQGVDLVLARRTGTLSGDTPREFVSNLRAMNVIYATDDLDLTDAVVERLQAAYDKRDQPVSIP